MTLLRSRPLTIAVAIGIVALLLVLYGINSGPVYAPAVPPAALKPLTALDKAKSAPPALFIDAVGRRRTLSEFRGHVVLLNLWAPWCAPCVKELPALAKLQAAMTPAQFSVVAVDVGRGGPEDAARFLKAHHAERLAAYVDRDMALMRSFDAYGLPTSIVIDGQGREIARAVGPALWDAPDSIAYFKKLSAKKE